MAERFKFKLFTGTKPDDQYAATNPHDALTFYLLSNGKGYLGDVLLFDGAQSASLIQTLATDMDMTAAASQIPSAAAVLNFVNSQLEYRMGGKFLCIVGSHTLTQADIDGGKMNIPDGCTAGCPGLLFTADSDSDDTNANESYYFISLKEYLSSVNTFKSTNSINMTTSPTNEVTADLKIADGEGSILVGEGGLSLNKVDATSGINEATPDAQKLVDEASLVSYVNNSVLKQVNDAITEFLEKSNLVTYSKE